MSAKELGRVKLETGVLSKMKPLAILPGSEGGNLWASFRWHS